MLKSKNSRKQGHGNQKDIFSFIVRQLETSEKQRDLDHKGWTREREKERERESGVVAGLPLWVERRLEWDGALLPSSRTEQRGVVTQRYPHSYGRKKQKTGTPFSLPPAETPEWRQWVGKQIVFFFFYCLFFYFLFFSLLFLLCAVV